MKLTILKDHLIESIGHVSKAISSRTTIPILTGIKIDATLSGVTLTASDTDISIQSFTPSENDRLKLLNYFKPEVSFFQPNFLSKLFVNYLHN